MKLLKVFVSLVFIIALCLPLVLSISVQGDDSVREAATTDLNVLTDDLFNGFGDKGSTVDECSNPPVANRSFEDNKFIFDERETVEDGLGPVYNDLGCGSCHQNPEIGGISQINELRAGHMSGGNFVEPPGGSLVHLRSVAGVIQERMDDAPLENIRTFRTTLNVIGDGFVEAIGDDTFDQIRSRQPAGFQGTIIRVPVVEAGGTLRVARFGWKNQHASLVSFSGDAYLNEMGITNVFDGNQGRRENTCFGESVANFDRIRDPEDDGDDVEAFANFMRATSAPGRGPINGQVRRGEDLFVQAACSFCHTPSITTVPPGTLINGGQFRVPSELGNKVIHPFSDFMLHDIGTGDGIVQNGGQATRNMVRTPPLWGLRTHPMLMHDGQSFTFSEAIQRHAGVGGTHSRNFFNNLSSSQKADLIAFLKSL